MRVRVCVLHEFAVDFIGESKLSLFKFSSWVHTLKYMAGADSPLSSPRAALADLEASHAKTVRVRDMAHAKELRLQAEQHEASMSDFRDELRDQYFNVMDAGQADKAALEAQLAAQQQREERIKKEGEALYQAQLKAKEDELEALRTQVCVLCACVRVNVCVC